MKNSIFLLLALLLLITACNTQKVEDVEIELSFADDFSEAWNRSKIYTLALADSMPDSLYSYKPRKDVFTFSKQLTHTIDFAMGQLMAHELLGDNPFAGKKWAEMSKEDVMSSVEACIPWSKKLSKKSPMKNWQQQLTYLVKKFPPSVSSRPSRTIPFTIGGKPSCTCV